MGKEEIIEGNAAIAKFEGRLEVIDVTHGNGKKQGQTFKAWYLEGASWVPLGNEDRLEYHRSWSWLMPVVKKAKVIYPKNFGAIEPTMFSMNDALVKADIESVWLACVEFIKWYEAFNRKGEVK
jgi:hypothetical protein